MNKFKIISITLLTTLGIQVSLINLLPSEKVSSLINQLKFEEKNEDNKISDFKIIETKVGINKNRSWWFPKILIKIKNISNKDISEKHRLKAVYLNSKDNTILYEDVESISNEVRIFPSQTVKNILLEPTILSDFKLKEDMKREEIVVKLYFDNQLIGNYPQTFNEF